MAAVPEGENVFDAQGTVLYRVVSEGEYLVEANPPPSAAVSSNAAVSGGGGATAAGGRSTTTLPSVSRGHGAAAAKGLHGTMGSNTGATAARGGGTPPPARLTPILGAAGAPPAATPSGQPTMYSKDRSGFRSGRQQQQQLQGQSQGTATLRATGAYDPGNTHVAALRVLEKLFPPVPLDDDGREIVPDPDKESDNSRSGGDNGHPELGKPPQQQLKGSSSMRNTMLSATGGQGVPGETYGANWLKVAAHTHTSRLDAILLRQHLERRCVDEHARPRGTLCPIRERIFNAGLQELTRQITVLCPERGQLLQELGDSIDQATGTYDVLLDSASQYAVRKSTERDLKSYLFDDQKELETEVRRGENRVHELQAKYDGMKKRFEELKAATEKVHEAEIRYAKLSNQQIMSEIKRLMSAAEK